MCAKDFLKFSARKKAREQNAQTAHTVNYHTVQNSFISVTGNRTLVSRVTGGDTSHYTMTDVMFQMTVAVRLETMVSIIILLHVLCTSLALTNPTVDFL
jgi:hypothetical protein